MPVPIASATCAGRVPVFQVAGGGGGGGSTVNLAVAHATSPYITAYPWSSGFGVKCSDPGILPTGTGNGVAFSPAV